MKITIQLLLCNHLISIFQFDQTFTLSLSVYRNHLSFMVGLPTLSFSITQFTSALFNHNKLEKSLKGKRRCPGFD